jgi:EAL domain-containing protein (putative c-di-GMP-specific phosphodiesterase class I)
VANREFGIYLQPKFNLSEEIIGAEALMRWFHPDFGVLLPGSFIDIVEENDLILPIGELILDQACNTLKRWQSSPDTKHLEIAINLSAKEVWQSNFVDNFIERVSIHGVDNSKLVAEVTESVLIQDINDATEKLKRLRSHGINVSLDDFGTGYSSLSYLRNLPIDELKIDKSFIHDITIDEQARLMVKSIIELARNFNLKVVSEGVENRDQFEVLKSLGVSSFQGYYFSKPLPEG